MTALLPSVVACEQDEATDPFVQALGTGRGQDTDSDPARDAALESTPENDALRGQQRIAPYAPHSVGAPYEQLTDADDRVTVAGDVLTNIFHAVGSETPDRYSPDAVLATADVIGMAFGDYLAELMDSPNRPPDLTIDAYVEQMYVTFQQAAALIADRACERAELHITPAAQADASDR